MRRAIVAVWVLAALGLLGGMGLYQWATAPLPPLDGTFTAPGVTRPVTVYRDAYGVPHIVAQNEHDGAYALGWVAAQDRLFQIELMRHVGQGRLAELFGADLVEVDQLFRAMAFHQVGLAMYRSSSPEFRRMSEAYAQGVNDYVASRQGNLPVEFSILGLDWTPLKPEDMAGVVGYMSWTLHFGWPLDPAMERASVKVGEPALRGLVIPFTPSSAMSPAPNGGLTHAPASANRILPGRWQPNPRAAALLDILPTAAGSNAWAMAPGRTTQGKAVLFNDPHLDHGQPGLWYQAWVKGGDLDLWGAHIPGMPLFPLGRNSNISWGMTAVMVDGGDYFLEKTRPAVPGGEPTEVMFQGRWVPLTLREEWIRVKGEDQPRKFIIRSTPHGPLVTDLMKGETRPLSYSWVFLHAPGRNDFEGVFRINRAKNWPEFRKGAGQLAGVSMHLFYADQQGHIGMQTAGAVPQLKGRKEGFRYRVGWDGSEDWTGVVPFEHMPFVYDPPEGYVTNSNELVTARGGAYITHYWEPLDRHITVARELTGRGKLSLAQMQALQTSFSLESAREEIPRLRTAFQSPPGPSDEERLWLERLTRWDKTMRGDSPEASVFAAYYDRLYQNIFADELGVEDIRLFRRWCNLNATLLRRALNDPRSPWFDRIDTPQKEDRDTILRQSFSEGLAAVKQAMGTDPRYWAWNRRVSIEFVHPLGMVGALSPFFNVGPFPTGGHANTVNKMEYDMDTFRVFHGPSIRNIFVSDPQRTTLSVQPTGQSGIPASPHYGDQARLFLEGAYLTHVLDADASRALAQHTLVLQPPR
ncbi:MAG: penicillin acylase family protein [Deltaproteobacteria bacterium]|nr:penicillin acylase family protein [Deltaproteobacteria bacterium]